MTFKRTYPRLIYPAGPSAILETMERYIARLKEAGFRITFDWTAEVRKAGDASPDDLEVRRKAARADLIGVLTADIVWVVQPDASSTSTGCWVELGYALGLRDAEGRDRPSIVVSGSSKKCIFSDLADYRFASHDDALEFIIGGDGRTRLDVDG